MSWRNRFGPLFAAEIRRNRLRQMAPLPQWRLDEVFVRINGETHCFWRAVDQKGEVLEAYVSRRRDRAAALTILRKLLRRYSPPRLIATDKSRSYGAALRAIGCIDRHSTGRRTSISRSGDENGRCSGSGEPGHCRSVPP